MTRIAHFIHAQRGEVTRQELATACGLSKGTVSRAVAALIDMGLVTEEEPIKTGRDGRPTNPIRAQRGLAKFVRENPQ